MRHGLGRLPAPDARDAHYTLRKIVPKKPTAEHRHWRTGPVLDQGQVPQCVAYAWCGFLESSPIRTKAHESPMDIYRAARLVDEWEGENYDGTSVRAGAKVMQDEGHIAQYVWATKADEVANWILSAQGGPVVMGTDWHDSMFNPDSKGLVRLDGNITGGHAWLIYGFNRGTNLFFAQNSWGTGWGRNGRFLIRFDDLETLLADQGEAATALEVPRIAPPA